MFELLTVASLVYVSCCIFNYMCLKDKTIKIMKKNNERFILEDFVVVIIKRPQLTLTIIKDYYVSVKQYIENVRFSVKHRELIDALVKHFQENDIKVKNDLVFTIMQILFTLVNFNIFSSDKVKHHEDTEKS